MMLDPRMVAWVLGGDVVRRNVVAPGPGHSRADRSLSVQIDPAAPEGFRCHSRQRRRGVEAQPRLLALYDGQHCMAAA